MCLKSIIDNLIRQSDGFSGCNYPEELCVLLGFGDKSWIDELDYYVRKGELLNANFLDVSGYEDLRSVIVSSKDQLWLDKLSDLIYQRIAVGDNKPCHESCEIKEMFSNIERLYRAVVYMRGQLHQRTFQGIKIKKVNKKEAASAMASQLGKYNFFVKGIDAGEIDILSTQKNLLINNVVVDVGSYGGYFDVYLSGEDVSFSAISDWFGMSTKIYYYDEDERKNKLNNIMKIVGEINNQYLKKWDV